MEAGLKVKPDRPIFWALLVFANGDGKDINCPSLPDL